MERSEAPWTDTQVRALNGRQRSGDSAPYTCPHDHLVYNPPFDEDVDLAVEPEMPHATDVVHADHIRLVADNDGMWCPADTCNYTQTWAHTFTLTSQ